MRWCDRAAVSGALRDAACPHRAHIVPTEITIGSAKKDQQTVFASHSAPMEIRDAENWRRLRDLNPTKSRPARIVETRNPLCCNGFRVGDGR